MSTPPPAPESSARKDPTGAFVWTLCAAAVAVYAFMKAPDAGDNRLFYLIAGAVAVIAALWNGYGAIAAFQQKTPPTA